MIYASYGRGFKSGGWNVDFSTFEQIAFDDEQVDSFEVGLKTDFWDAVVDPCSSIYGGLHRLPSLPVCTTGKRRNH